MFGFITGPKVMDPSKRGALANAAYKKGVDAINKYIEMGNDGLGMQVCSSRGPLMLRRPSLESMSTHHVMYPFL